MLSFADIVRWLAGKALTALLLLAALVVCSVLWSYVPSWWDLLRGARDRAIQLQFLTAQLANEEGLVRSLEAQLDAAEKNGPSIFKSPFDWWTHRQGTKAIRSSLDNARGAAAETRLKIDRLRGAASGLADRIYHALMRWWLTFFWIIAVVLAGPFVWRSFAFFILAPLAARVAPLQLEPPEAPGHAAAAPPGRSLMVQVPPGETFYFRPGCIQQRRDAATGSALARFPLAPLITSAGRLFGLTRVKAADKAKPAIVVLSSGDPDTYFTVLELRNHPGFVLHPRHVAGFSKGIGILTRWKVFRLHSLLTGQFRYVMFTGSGSLVLQGRGGVLAETGSANPSKIEEPAVAGFDSRATFATTRTEQALAYIFGRVPLMDDQFGGPFLFLREVSPGMQSGKLIHRTLGVLWSAIGKLLGF